MAGILPCEEKHEGPCGQDLQNCESSTCGKNLDENDFSPNPTVLHKLSENTEILIKEFSAPHLHKVDSGPLESITPRSSVGKPAGSKKDQQHP